MGRTRQQGAIQDGNIVGFRVAGDAQLLILLQKPVVETLFVRLAQSIT